MVGRLVLLLSINLTWPAAALACPLCSSDTGGLVRKMILDDFGSNAAAVAIPFLLVVFIVRFLQGRTDSAEN